jgi:4-amino-4-deoxy-L-arabinose transferase-like glycosyltransferase
VANNDAFGFINSGTVGHHEAMMSEPMGNRLIDRAGLAVDSTTMRLGGVAIWLISGLLLFIGLGVPTVTRTQEARVLETAREMVGAPFKQWMLPQVNGHPRLQKPPLAYWLTAASFWAFGVGEAQGRLPAALASWITVGLTMLMARRLFGVRAACMTGVAMVGSIMFFRHARLAETDILVMAFVTASIMALWHAFGIDDDDEYGPAGTAVLNHLAAVMAALAVLSKGPGGAFPFIFLIAMGAVERHWRPLRAFALCGAPVTFIALAAPWFVYVAYDQASVALAKDMELSMTGKGWDLPFIYIPPLIMGFLPWTLLLVAALVAAVGRWRANSRVLGLLVWTSAILLPLMLWGNKQKHYLLPVIPPLMLLVGWQIDRMIAACPALSVRPAEPQNLGDHAWRLTLFAYAAATIAIPIAGFYADGRFDAMDLAMTLLVGGTAGATFIATRRRGRGAAIVTLAAGNLLVIAFGMSPWANTVQPVNTHTISSAIAARYSNAPLVFVGQEHLGICWELRRIIPLVKTEAQLSTVAETQPGLVAIEAVRKGATPTSAMLTEQLRFDDSNNRTFMVGPVVTGVTAQQARHMAPPAKTVDP